MFFPLRDDQPRFSKPFVNYFIIALNIAVYVLLELPAQAQGRRAFDVLILQFGLIPHDLTRAIAGVPQYPLGANILTILTSMFLHGDLFHILGNLWFLWIFGDNIEDHMGHFPYLIFYLICGVAAALTDIALTPTSNVPTIGASGAIAGIMGAYVLLYPRARVQTLVVLIVFFTFWWLPAWIFLGYWFLIQFVATTVMASSVHHQTGGVAFAAHVGGFVTGLILIKLFPRRRVTQRYASW
jgi:membrane associated rhomboid family serine protease